MKKYFFIGSELDIPDGGPPDHLSKCAVWLAASLQQLDDKSMVYMPAWEGGHQDHDALHAAAVSVAKELGVLQQLWQFPLYNRYRCVGPFFKVFNLLPANGNAIATPIPWVHRLRFLRYCLSYSSQAKTWMGLFPFVVLHYCFNGKQLLQPVSHPRLNEPPHTGLLFYEKRGSYTWREMTARLAGLNSGAVQSIDLQP